MGTKRLTVGVLAIQGGFSAHVEMLRSLTMEGMETKVVLIRKSEQLDDIDGLIIPGGESSVLSIHFSKGNLMEKLKSFVENTNKFTWGTCAGLIVLSKNVQGEGKSVVTTIGGLDITCERNYSGRQIHSCESSIRLLHPDLICCNGGVEDYNGVFIRPPGIISIEGSDVMILSKRGSEESGWESNGVQQGNIMACTFHPELCNSSAWHKYFLQCTMQYKQHSLRG